MVRSISCGLRPRPTDSEPCGSKSTSSTLRPYSASAAPRLIVVVVLPTPPFWLHIEIDAGVAVGGDRARLGEVRHRPAGGAEHDLGRSTGSSTGRRRPRLDARPGLGGRAERARGVGSGRRRVLRGRRRRRRSDQRRHLGGSAAWLTPGTPNPLAPLMVRPLAVAPESSSTSD